MRALHCHFRRDRRRRGPNPKMASRAHGGDGASAGAGSFTKFPSRSKLRAMALRLPRTPTASRQALTKMAHQGSPDASAVRETNEFLDAAVVRPLMEAEIALGLGEPWRARIGWFAMRAAPAASGFCAGPNAEHVRDCTGERTEPIGERVVAGAEGAGFVSGDVAGLAAMASADVRTSCTRQPQPLPKVGQVRSPVRKATRSSRYHR